MERKLLVYLICFCFSACVNGKSEKAIMVQENNQNLYLGEWTFAPSIFSDNLISKNHPEYQELLKEKFSIILTENYSLIIKSSNKKVVFDEGWDYHSYPNDLMKQKSVVISMKIKNQNLLSGNYFITRKKDSLFLFKNIHEDFEGLSDYIRFIKK